MIVNRLKIPLSEEENQALDAIAQVELRSPSDQARLILRQEFMRRGLIASGDDERKAESIQKKHK